jgi:hypothetical protein
MGLGFVPAQMSAEQQQHSKGPAYRCDAIVQLCGNMCELTQPPQRRGYLQSQLFKHRAAVASDSDADHSDCGVSVYMTQRSSTAHATAQQ